MENLPINITANMFEKYENRGLTGLCNLGNTCFINTCMQALSNTYELNEFLDDKRFINKLKKSADTQLLIEWDNLRKMMWDTNCIISPGKFVKTIHKVAKIKNMPLFSGYSQNDVSEFLTFIIDCFHNSISREIQINIKGSIKNDKDSIAHKCYKMIQEMYSKDYSEILNIFYGIHISQIISLDTGKILSIKPEPYFSINMTIPDTIPKPTLYDCFNLYVQGDIMSGDNAWFNEETGKLQNVKKSITHWNFPNILVLNLKRFDNFNNKNNKLVDFPIADLNLNRYIVGYKNDTFIYDLYAICNHSNGNANFGHYTAFIKNANEKWYYYNDENVIEVKDYNNIITCHAYCLFYRKQKL